MLLRPKNSSNMLFDCEHAQKTWRGIYLSQNMIKCTGGTFIYVYNVVKRDGGPFIFRVRICSSNMQEGCLFELLCDQM